MTSTRMPTMPASPIVCNGVRASSNGRLMHKIWMQGEKVASEGKAYLVEGVCWFVGDVCRGMPCVSGNVGCGKRA
jgi:hypothetical protein